MEMIVRQVIETFGVSQRTLDYYEEIGLVGPSESTVLGNPLYTEGDIERLRQILFYRRLLLPLEEVVAIVDGHIDPQEPLERQRESVVRRIGELGRMLLDIDTALGREPDEEIVIKPAAGVDALKPKKDGEDEAEADEWDDWNESRERNDQPTREQWQEIRDEGEQVVQAFLTAKRVGLPPTSSDAMDAAEAHRRHINSRFYACDYEMQRGLGDMYATEPRFTARYDEAMQEPGLAQYVRDAIYANADRHDPNVPKPPPPPIPPVPPVTPVPQISFSPPHWDDPAPGTLNPPGMVES